ncbi:hypothetical protein [Psychrobacillus sp. FSL H8-0510]|uniref:hypothetical protein n=1 Tax=Psychrobacillus sp. FSL H8-0510 TaxID=2921394 RepID=UPI0030FC23B7
MKLQIKVDENWINFKSVHIKKFNNLETDFIFLVDHKIRATGQLRFDYSDIYMDNVEAIEKRKGYGEMLVKYLKHQKQVERITGQSTAEAYGFWEKMKAVFNHRTFKDEGVYSFHIPCN